MKKQTALRPLVYQPNEPLLHKAMMQAAQSYLTEAQDHRFANTGSLAKMLLLLVICLTCYGLSLRQHTGGAFFCWYLGFITSGMLLLINVFHDASHNAFFRTRWANVLINRLVSIPLGMDPDCWRVRHVIFHHSHTNIAGYDPDIDENGILRQTPFQRWRPIMRMQHAYWPIVAALTFPWYIWLVDWLDRAGKTRVTAHMAQQGWYGWVIFLGSKSAHFILALGIPIYFLSATLSAMTIIMVYLLCQMLSSLIFVMLIVGTHWAKANFFEAPETGCIAHDRYHHVFATTFDWQIQPARLGYWLGGMNLHLTHHIFANWNHRHYPALSRVIAQTAQQFGIDYQQLSLPELLRLQQHFLREMGAKPQVKKEESSP